MEGTAVNSPPKVFISYSWDSDRHKEWVRYLAERLVRAGVDVSLDQWRVKEGESFTQFMEEGVAASDFIIAVLTPAYAKKSNSRKGGAGYEQQIVSGQIMAGTPRSKFIPVLRTGKYESGPKCAIPTHFSGIVTVDFRKGQEFEKKFEDLLRAIYSRPKFAPPSLGEPPLLNTIHDTTLSIAGQAPRGAGNEMISPAGDTNHAPAADAYDLRSNLISVTICQFHRTVSYLPLYVAQLNRYFEAEGLSVTLVEGYGDDTTWNTVMCGNAQFGVADPLIMLEEPPSDNGKVVAAISTQAAFWGITRKSIAPLRDGKEFIGKTVAVYKSPSTAYLLIKKILLDHQIEDRVRIVEMAPESEYSLLKDANIDIVFVPEPKATVAILDGAHKMFSATKYFGDFLITGLFTTDKFIRENPEIVQRVVNALERSLRFIRSNPLNAVKVAAREFPDLPKFAIELATFNLLADQAIPDHTIILENSWNTCLQVRRPKDAANFLFYEYVDNSFSRRAMEKYP